VDDRTVAEHVIDGVACRAVRLAEPQLEADRQRLQVPQIVDHWDITTPDGQHVMLIAAAGNTSHTAVVCIYDRPFGDLLADAGLPANLAVQTFAAVTIHTSDTRHARAVTHALARHVANGSLPATPATAAGVARWQRAADDATTTVTGLAD
jgi:hypothetical protein